MIFQFTASPHFDFITQFAGQIGVPVRDDFLEIPKKMGEGYVRKADRRMEKMLWRQVLMVLSFTPPMAIY